MRQASGLPEFLVSVIFLTLLVQILSFSFRQTTNRLGLHSMSSPSISRALSFKEDIVPRRQCGQISVHIVDEIAIRSTCHDFAVITPPDGESQQSRDTGAEIDHQSGGPQVPEPEAEFERVEQAVHAAGREEAPNPAYNKNVKDLPGREADLDKAHAFMNLDMHVSAGRPVVAS